MIPQFIINDIYLEKYLYDRSRYVILLGGRGSGKSVAAAQKIIFRCIEESPEHKGTHKFLVVRKTLPSLKRSCWPLMIRLLDNLKIRYLLNKTEMTIQIGKHQIMFISMDDPEKVKSIEGITSAWIEEATELTENEFITLDLCLRGLTRWYKQITLTFNPMSELHWINKQMCYDVNLETQNYIHSPKDDRTVIKTTYQDNIKFLDKQYIKRLEDLKHQNKNLYRVFALGLWGGMQGIIYNDNYKIIQVSRYENMPWDEKIYGLDFGFNNPTAMVEIKIRDQEYYIKQMLYETGLTNRDLINRIQTMGIDTNCRIYCDTAEPARIEELRRAGLNAVESEKDVNLGISTVQACQLYIYENSSELLKEIKTYSWQEKNDGEYIDKPVKLYDHLLDALRYAIYTHSRTGAAPLSFIGIYDLDKNSGDIQTKKAQ